MSDTPFDVAQLDLSRHGVIEASAGTGKTYTIERLVQRLVTQASVKPEEIFIVTFTEKATGELKTRLRRTLERSVLEEPAAADVVRTALDHFDQMPIFTIHGFCQRLLQEYALEQGQDFGVALANDLELLRAGLREIQRKRWRTHFGPQLREVLEWAGYSRDTAADWDRKVLDIAAKYKPRSDHQLRPALADNWWQHLGNPEVSIRGQLEAFTVGLLRQHLHDHKRQRGLQSFDDMIGLVEENLDPDLNPSAEAFLQTLRQRYRYGIVDEFQDTDPLQWRIFRRIFLEGGDARLFVVGDPKQAIFGFRGADLPTYLKASRTLRDEAGAESHPLQTNWRSEPDLLEALNCVFGDGEWFPPATGIRYLPVAAPDDDKRKTRVIEDRTDRAALTLVDVGASESFAVARKQFARFVASEIQRLLRPGAPTLTYVHGRQPECTLTAADFCILVQKRLEAEPIINALRQAGIPYSFYKQTGLWQSEEAVQIETLLRALSRPEERSSFRKALLTGFIRVSAPELARAPELPPRHPARRLYQKWLVDAEKRHWSSLFQSLLEETGVLLGHADSPDGDRRLANLRHLLGVLEQAGHGENRDLLGLLDWIKARRQQRDAGDADVQPIESERPKVKIMTMHASKGLEFPIVFLAGGFTRNPRSSLVSYRDDEGRLVFDLCPNSEAEQRVVQEQLSEQRRLLYVALTRPMFKLYVPQVKITDRNRSRAGALGTVLWPALQKACPDKLGFPVSDLISAGIFTEPRPGDAADDETPIRVEPFPFEGPLFPVLNEHIGRRRIAVRSFSSMNRQHITQLGDGASYGDLAPRPLDETATAPEADDPLRGPAFGDIVHTVLEEIDFAAVGRAASPEDLGRVGTPAEAIIARATHAQIGEFRTRTPREALEIACREQVARLVWHALHTPLAALGGPLWRVAVADRLHELDFHYPEFPDGPIPTEVRREEGFVTGFMDLVVRANGRYFLIDWKTNILPGYESPHIERAMDEADYHRQYRLYLQALECWFRKTHGPRFDFLRQFGGVYYLFVRGLNGQDERTGVFYHRATDADLDLQQVLYGRPETRSPVVK